MPGFDRTGPVGAGSMTGRQLGRCVGNLPGRGLRGFGRGFRGGYGRGYGRGPGFRLGSRFWDDPGDYWPDVSDETLLENEARALKDHLSRVEQQLEKMRKGKEKE